MEDKEIDYALFRKTLGFMKLNTVILKKDLSNIAESDKGLKDKALLEGAYGALSDLVRDLRDYPYTFTQYTDELGMSVFLINAGRIRAAEMDDTDLPIVLVGPFVEIESFGLSLKKHFEKLGYPESVYPLLKQYVECIPYYVQIGRAHV